MLIYDVIKAEDLSSFDGVKVNRERLSENFANFVKIKIRECLSSQAKLFL